MSVVVSTLTFAGAVSAWAGSNVTTYNTTVGSRNGYGYTGWRTKAIQNHDVYLLMYSVGGNYVVDLRIDGHTNMAWSRNVGDNHQLLMDDWNAVGTSERIQFSNDLSTPVDVQVTGEWINY